MITEELLSSSSHVELNIAIISTALIILLIIIGIVIRVVNASRETAEGNKRKLIDMEVYSLFMLFLSVLVILYFVYEVFYGTLGVLSFIILANGILGIITSIVYYFGELVRDKKR